MSDTRLIVGLGNPGKDYEYTRHNIGFLALRCLAERLNIKFSLSSLTNGLVADGVIDGKVCCFLMPLTYMNHSGVAVKQFIENRNITLDDILVLTDDFNLPFGNIRLRAKGSDGGHNGLTSIIHQLQASDFARLRMGIGKPAHSDGYTDYVLGQFDENEKKQLGEFVDRAADGSLVWFKEGIKKAMEKFNVREKNG